MFIVFRRPPIVRMAVAAIPVLMWTLSLADAAPAKPNIVLILADDLGYGDVGCYGRRDIKTPAIDRLATQGVRLTNFYANGPECSPTRTALMTGRYQHRVGGLECAIGTGNVGRYDDAIRLRESNDLGLPANLAVLPSILIEQGYMAVAFGKWHLGYEKKFFPLRHGWDAYFGPLGGGVDYFHHTEWDGVPVLYENNEPVRKKGYITDLISDRAVKFVETHEGKPFFLYVPYTAPHSPYQGPDDEQPEPLLQPDWNKGSTKTYIEMIERMDQGIGRIIEAIDRKGFADNTLVIFASDNGANRMGDNGGLRGYKSGLFEGGIRVPCIIRYPRVLEKGAVSHQSCITMDLTSAIVGAAGGAAPAGRPFDGLDIIRLLSLKKKPADRTLFWRQRRGDRTWRALRDGDMKYVTLKDTDVWEEYLFDLAADQGEKINLLETRPHEAERLKKLLASFELDMTMAR